MGAYDCAGLILLCAIAIIVTAGMLFLSERKKAAVGRRYGCPDRNRIQALTITSREMQLFLIGYIIISICEIFTVGGFPLSSTARSVSPTTFEGHHD